MKRYYFPIFLAVTTGTVARVNGGSLTPPPGPVAATNRVQLNSQAVVLPYTIGASGSYVLTSNLTGVTGEHGIIIGADDVKLDLNGFALVGVSGSLDGIHVSGTHSNVVIGGGAVRGWDQDGIDVTGATGGRVSDISSNGNGAVGIGVGPSMTVFQCAAESNGTHGFEASGSASFFNCTAFANAADGFRLSDGGVVEQSRASLNQEAGIHAGADGNRMDTNHVADNGRGIEVSGIGNLVIRNSAVRNGLDYQIAAGNSFGPIVTGTGNLLQVFNGNHPWANFVLICTPTTEVCDGIDNDCDQQVDEGIPNQGPCDGPDSDLCPEGSLMCQGGSMICSDNTPDTLDRCNNADDDCDPASADGSEDPLVDTPCDGPDTDLCLEGTRSCSGGLLVCSDNTGNNVEICNGTDDDCDGQTDEFACPLGTACSTGATCQSGACADGFCCNNPCSTVCLACSAAKTGIADGTCAPIPNGSDPDNECAGTATCNGSGACTGQPNGSPCSTGGQCQSSFCVDGFCCNTSCANLCEACSAAKTGATNGTCAFIPDNTDPDSECDNVFAPDCTGAGTCGL